MRACEGGRRGGREARIIMGAHIEDVKPVAVGLISAFGQLVENVVPVHAVHAWAPRHVTVPLSALCTRHSARRWCPHGMHTH